MSTKTLRADLILLLAAILWGAAFSAQRVAMQHMEPMTFNALRFALGVLVLIPVVVFRSRRSAEATESSGHARIYLLGGLAAGFVLFTASTLQQIGVVYTTAGKAGFITGLYMPLVPILGLVIGTRTSIATWIGAALAVVGLYFLSVPDSLTINRGDKFVMACAVVWAVHVLLIGKLAPRTDPIKLAMAQFAFVALASLVGALLCERITVEGIHAAMWAILYGGAISVGIAFTLQVVGQRNAPPAHAALVLSLETVFSAIGGYLILGEVLGPREIFGAALMLGGMLVSQIRHVLPQPASDSCGTKADAV